MLRRVEALEALLASCIVCPLDCGNNRLKGELARCYSGRLPIVSSYTAHFGEEPALVFRNTERLDVIKMLKLTDQYEAGEMKLTDEAGKVVAIVDKELRKKARSKHGRDRAK